MKKMGRKELSIQRNPCKKILLSYQGENPEFGEHRHSFFLKTEKKIAIALFRNPRVITVSEIQERLGTKSSFGNGICFNFLLLIGFAYHFLYEYDMISIF